MTRIWPFLALGLAGTLACTAPSDSERTCTDRGSALRVCAAGPIVHGIDVSKYEGTIDWPRVKATGQAFAFARVSDGTQFPDAYFDQNWKHMKGVGLVRGVYQFFRPGTDPLAQADLLLSHVANAGGFEPGDLPPVVDVEVRDGKSPAVIQANLLSWLTKVEAATGRRPMIYTAAFMSSALGNAFTSYPLWVANYGVVCPSLPENFTSWLFWQASETGHVDGITGNVDLDEFNGSLADLLHFAAGNPPVDAGALDADIVEAAAPTDTPDAGCAMGCGSEPPPIPQPPPSCL